MRSSVSDVMLVGIAVGGASDDLAAASRRGGAQQAVPGRPPALDVDGDGLLVQR